jgi:uncharacterized membrane protein YfcA
MKIQDLAFIVVLLALFLLKKKNLFVYAGVISLVVSMVFYAKWIFYTAQRLTWYAAAFFLICSIMTVLAGETMDNLKKWGNV